MTRHASPEILDRVLRQQIISEIISAFLPITISDSRICRFTLAIYLGLVTSRLIASSGVSAVSAESSRPRYIASVAECSISNHSESSTNYPLSQREPPLDRGVPNLDDRNNIAPKSSMGACSAGDFTGSTPSFRFVFHARWIINEPRLTLVDGLD